MSQAQAMPLVRYDAMCTAIAECERVDEAKDIRDKARAPEVYAQLLKSADARVQHAAALQSFRDQLMRAA